MDHQEENGWEIGKIGHGLNLRCTLDIEHTSFEADAKNSIVAS